MSIKIVLLKSGETIITDVKEIISDDKVCGYLFKEPYCISLNKDNKLLLIEDEDREFNSSVQISLSPWIVLTSDTEIPVPPDWMVTIVEPIDTIKEMYEERMNDKQSEMFITEE